MARLTFTTPLTSLKGSIGSTTFQANASGYIARLRPDRITTYIKNTYSKFNSLANRTLEWKALAPLTQSLWNTFASLHTKIDYYGNTKSLTGFNWYCSINNYLTNCGIGLLTSPPVYASTLPVPPFTFNVNDNGPILTPVTPYTLTGNYIFVFSSNNVQYNTTKNRSCYKFMEAITTGTLTTINFKTPWQNYFNKLWPSLGSLYNMHISCFIFHINALTGIPTQATFYNDGTNTNILGGIGNMVIENNFVIS